MHKVTVRKIRGGLGMIIPKPVTDKYQLKENDWVYFIETQEGGIVLNPLKCDVAWLNAYKRTHQKYRNMIRRLAAG